MLFILDELRKYFQKNLNPFLIQRGLPPLRRISTTPLSSDIFPSLQLNLREFSLAEQFSTPHIKVWRGAFNIILYLREDEEGANPLLGSYIEALRVFLEGIQTPFIFKNNCRNVTILPLKKPYQRGISFEFEILYIP